MYKSFASRSLHGGLLHRYTIYKYVYIYEKKTKPEVDFGSLPRPATLKIFQVLLKEKFQCIAWQLFPTSFWLHAGFPHIFISVVMFDSPVPRFWYVFPQQQFWKIIIANWSAELLFKLSHNITYCCRLAKNKVSLEIKPNYIKAKQTKSLSTSELWWQNHKTFKTLRGSTIYIWRILSDGNTSVD